MHSDSGSKRGCVSLCNRTGTRIKGWRSPTSAPGRACPGSTCLWFQMSSQTSKCADSSQSNGSTARASASWPLPFPPHFKRLPDGGGQGGRVQRRSLPAVVQESGGAGSRNLRLLAAFQHRLAVNHTANTLDRQQPEPVPRTSPSWCEMMQEVPV